MSCHRNEGPEARPPFHTTAVVCNVIDSHVVDGSRTTERPQGHSQPLALRREETRQKNGRKSVCTYVQLDKSVRGVVHFWGTATAEFLPHLVDANDTITPRACLRAMDPRNTRWTCTAAQRHACTRTKRAKQHISGDFRESGPEKPEVGFADQSRYEPTRANLQALSLAVELLLTVERGNHGESIHLSFYSGWCVLRVV